MADEVLHDDLFSRPGGAGLATSHHSIHELLDAPAGSVLLMGIAGALIAARVRAMRPLAIAGSPGSRWSG